MLLPTHLAAGLIIGKLTGDYTAAFIGSAAVDLDHLITYYRCGFLFKFKTMVLAATNQSHLAGNQRNYFHNVVFFLSASAIIFFFYNQVWLAFSAAYLGHLFLDSLDSQNYFPFYPNKKINLRGPIKYFSKQEIIFALALFFIFLVL